MSEQNHTETGDCVCPYAGAVANRIRQRAEHGLKKYGVTVARNDLSMARWLQHGQEEAMDLAVYLERITSDVAKLEADNARLRHENTLLTERLETARSRVPDWDELIVRTGGNVNDGVRLNVERIVKLCAQSGPAGLAI